MLRVAVDACLLDDSASLSPTHASQPGLSRPVSC
jgi:hypothetical protein